MNVLSVKPGTVLSGKQINDWCLDQVKYRRSHWKEAKRLLSKNYKNDVDYVAVRMITNSGFDTDTRLYFVTEPIARCNKRGIV